MNAKLITLLFIPALLTSSAVSKSETYIYSNSGDVIIKNSVKSTVNGESVEVRTDQPGKVEVKIEGENVTINTSPEITPTIIITTSQEKIEKTSVLGKQTGSLIDTKKAENNKDNNMVLAFFRQLLVKFFTAIKLVSKK